MTMTFFSKPKKRKSRVGIPAALNRDHVISTIRGYYEGLTSDGVAERLNISPGAASQRLSSRGIKVFEIRRMKRAGHSLDEVIAALFPEEKKSEPPQIVATAGRGSNTLADISSILEIISYFADANDSARLNHIAGECRKMWHDTRKAEQ